MGKRFENCCVKCATPAYPCDGDKCPNRNVPVYFCDKCKEEFEPEELYVIDDEELCVDCLTNKFETVAQRDL